MHQKRVQIIGLILTTVYAAAIIWLYATEPRSFKEAATGAQVAAGTYQVDQEKFNAAVALFRREQFRAARDEWQRAEVERSCFGLLLSNPAALIGLGSMSRQTLR